MGRGGLLRANRTAVLGESPTENVLARLRPPPSALLLRMAVSFSRTVAPRVRLVSAGTVAPPLRVSSGSRMSVWMAVSVLWKLGMADGSSVAMQTSAISAPKADMLDGNMM